MLSSQLGGETEGSVPPGGGSGSRHSEEQGRLPVGLRERAEAHGGKSSSRWSSDECVSEQQDFVVDPG